MNETITLPLADVRALVRVGWELTNYISETDKSLTGLIYGIELAQRAIARVAVLLPSERHSLLTACEQAEYWLRAELERPGQATPDEILRVLGEAIAKARGE